MSDGARQPAPPFAGQSPVRPRLSSPRRKPRARRMTIVTGILVFVILIVVLQLWLLTATLNAYLGGATEIVLPAALVSLGCLALAGGLLWYLYRLG